MAKYLVHFGLIAIPPSARCAVSFFDLTPGLHDLVAAAEAPELDIHAHAEHLPAFTAAGVLLFQL